MKQVGGKKSVVGSEHNWTILHTYMIMPISTHWKGGKNEKVKRI
jgi:hypothetical protein